MTTRPDVPPHELRAAFGGEVTHWSALPLTYNVHNAVSGGIWRVRTGERTAILKLVRRSAGTGSPDWVASDDPRNWNYWRRERELYASELPGELARCGVEVPRLLAVFDRSEEDCALWLEDVGGRRGDVWTLDEHAHAARALGRMGAGMAAHPERWRHPWSSLGFLRAYSDKTVDVGLLDDPSVWRDPRVDAWLGTAVRAAACSLLDRRERLLRLVEAAPRTLGHLDFWPMNLILRPDGSLVALDWAFAGDGAIGEDLGNHVPDSALDLFVPAERLPELDRVTFDAYLEGLRAGGWAGEPDRTRLALCASAVKYTWLLPSLLRRLLADEHRAYGGRALVDPEHQVRQRGTTLVFLARWADEALALAHR